MGDPIQVCGDCVVWIANADDTGLDLLDPAEAARRRTRRDASLEGLGGRIVVGDAEPSFSWDWCPICGDLPGMRHEVVVLSTH